MPPAAVLADRPHTRDKLVRTRAPENCLLSRTGHMTFDGTIGRFHDYRELVADAFFQVPEECRLHLPLCKQWLGQPRQFVSDRVVFAGNVDCRSLEIEFQLQRMDFFCNLRQASSPAVLPVSVGNGGSVVYADQHSFPGDVSGVQTKSQRDSLGFSPV